MPVADPPYVRIAAELRRRIEEGELRPGDRVPSTRAITQRWGVAMATASKVLAALRQEGLVRAVPGVGTVVCAAPPAGRAVGAGTGAPAGPGAAAASRGARTPAGSAAAAESAARERLVATALAVADAEGLGALTMRRLATELGVSAMSLYRHVENKYELVAMMADAAFASDALPAVPPTGWRARLELSARTQWRLYHAHPWLAAALNLDRPLLAPGGMRHVEWSLAALEGTGLDAASRLHAAVALFGHVRGYAVDLAAAQQTARAGGVTGGPWMAAQEERMAALLADGSFPSFTAVRASPAAAALSAESLFAFGLARHLDGIAALIAATGGGEGGRGATA
ncbi:TetR/AcrR family transcriptional regulator C-terminal domain-containing protein [Streptomyces sp. NRRL S-87]|uniref:TetR/AcrR family transcriptional regulator C-terminal domain-containing protein n=1 Tax=Streptomyces sp. NRRL S-87 TaxID=1463920 RepID=UPI0004BE7D48|nr:TetR/AcrR family transcriptional regulator C-terminal domain-containing protein [Streptomyces sp. NRRL S-87]